MHRHNFREAPHDDLWLLHGRLHQRHEPHLPRQRELWKIGHSQKRLLPPEQILRASTDHQHIQHSLRRA